MPYGLGERVGGGGPLAGRFLPGKHEPSSVSAGEPGNERCEVLTPPSLRIGNSFHGLRKLINLHGRRAVMLPPHLEQFSDALPTGVISLEDRNPLDGVSAAESEQRIATPFRPGLEASEGLAPRKHVLTTPAPDRETRNQEFRALTFNLVKKTCAELTQLRIFTAGVELAMYEAAGPVFGDGKAVFRYRNKSCAVQRYHSRLA